MRVTRFEQLDEMLADHDGMLQTSMVTAAGISKSTFKQARPSPHKDPRGL